MDGEAEDLPAAWVEDPPDEDEDLEGVRLVWVADFSQLVFKEL